MIPAKAFKISIQERRLVFFNLNQFKFDDFIVLISYIDLLRTFEKLNINHAKHRFDNVATSDFLAEIAAVSSMDISNWEKDWLQQTAFKAEQAYNSLIASPFIKDFFEINHAPK